MLFYFYPETISFIFKSKLMSLFNLQLLLSFPGNNPEEIVTTGVVIAIALIAISISLIILIFFCLTLQNLLKAIQKENRAMEPGMVWLLLIPILNWIWTFVVVINISKSIHAEYKSRNMEIEEKPLLNLGLVFAISGICNFIPYLKYIAWLVGLISFIMYWIKANEYKNKIREFPAAAINEIGQ